MKREILFRGKRVDNGEWIYGGYCYGNNRNYISEDIFLMEREISNEYEVENEGEEPVFEAGLKLGMFHLVIPETVSQFTGLTDKNGKKIFEGDLLQIPGYYCEVKFIDGMFCSVYNHPEDSEILWLVDLGVETMEIIGNIHDNENRIN